jgi:undecaprenyl-diphosphatase
MTTPDPRPLPDLETTAKPLLLLETVSALSLGIAVLASFLFAWIAESVTEQRTETFDLFVRTHIHHYASPPMTRLMFAITWLGGDGLSFAAILVLIIFIWLHWRRATLWMLVTLAGALVLDLTLKYAFHRMRPTPYFGPIPHTYSFPSGHALFSFCFYGVLAGLLAGRIRSLPLRIFIWTSAAILVLAIGISRIYLGVHYPSDVLGGYLTATLWVATMVALDRLHVQSKNRTSCGADTPVRRR